LFSPSSTTNALKFFVDDINSPYLLIEIAFSFSLSLIKMVQVI
jgi:hypothetical protein